VIAQASPAAEKLPVSVLVPTKDEERNLPSTLGHLGWAEQIIVFDSFSTDGTMAVARAAGAEIFQREFDNFADHKNWALDNLHFRNDWILIVDADEKVPASLVDEIRLICAQAPPYEAYYVARQIWVDGVWLKHAGKYPDYQLRFFRKGKARYERRIVHEHMIVDGRTGFLASHLVHVDEKGTRRYIERHNNYAEMEAVEAYIARHSREKSPPSATARIYEKRRTLKLFAYRSLPFRPLFVFLYLYVFRLGFVMGKAGLKTCVLRMFYEYMIDMYLDEVRDQSSPIHVKYRDYIDERCAE
jgi:glycosyltransferase involved in cell wall biosynthesis